MIRTLRQAQEPARRRFSSSGWILKGVAAAAAVALIAVLGAGITMLLDEDEAPPGRDPVAARDYVRLLAGLTPAGTLSQDHLEGKRRLADSNVKVLMDTSGSMRTYDFDQPRSLEQVAKEIRDKSIVPLESPKSKEKETRDTRDSFLRTDADPMMRDGSIRTFERMPDVSVPDSLNTNQALGIQNGDKDQPPLNLPAPGGFGGKGQGGAIELGNGTISPYTYNMRALPAGATRSETTTSKVVGKKTADPGYLLPPMSGSGSSSSGKPSDAKAGESSKDKRDPKPMAGIPPPVATIPAAPMLPGSTTPPPTDGSYVQPGLLFRQSGTDKENKAQNETGADKKIDKLAQQVKDLDAGEKQAGKQPVKEQPKTEQQPEAPPEPGKFIIRTGDVDFEVDSFDAAVLTIQKLVGATKGGYVATINSDKLPNGKVRGAVAVRVPPGQLDKLVLDLRAALSKTGELKGQRIGSQDITKQYTDLQSRLKAARTMEERLLKIIKDGKGEIKDLILAEKELGIWHTKIEELEGELRYYGNLVSLSTLTINLAEKEIHVAAAVSESERVQAGIEVEDVEKSMREVLKAVEDVKGRVTQSELKQHAAGQLNAVLVFEVAPDSAGLIRDRLKQLGTVARLEIDRIQTAEGGTKLPQNGKLERGKTQFRVSLYNLANIAPRETVTIRVAADDVPMAYRALREAVTKAKGRVLNADLREQDQQNVGAQLDFDIRRIDEGGVQAALSGSGDVLSRHVARVAEAENVTDTKVRFNVQLVASTSIAPRETVTIRLAANDVPGAYRTLREMNVKSGARVLTASLQEQDRLRVSAQLDFNMRRSDEGQFLAAMTAAGDVLSRHVARSGDGENVTDKRILYRIEFINAANIAPREVVTLKVAAADVPAAYRTVREAVAKAEARVLTADLQEQDRQKISAQLDFDVQRKEEAAVLTTLNSAVEVLFRQVTRAAESENVTDKRVWYKVEFVPATAVEPREVVGFAIEVTDVENALSVLSAQVKELQGRIVEGPKSAHEQNGRVTALVVYDVPLSSAPAVAEKLRNSGQVRASRTTPNPQAPEGKLALARFNVRLENADPVVPRDEGVWAQSRSIMAFSFRGLSLSLTVLIVGALFAIPWLLVIAVVVWLVRRIWWSAPPTVNLVPAGPTTPTAPVAG